MQVVRKVKGKKMQESLDIYFSTSSKSQRSLFKNVHLWMMNSGKDGNKNKFPTLNHSNYSLNINDRPKLFLMEWLPSLFPNVKDFTSFTVRTHRFPWICTNRFNFENQMKLWLSKKKKCLEGAIRFLPKVSTSTNKEIKIKYFDSNKYLVLCPSIKRHFLPQQMPIM